MRLVRASLLVSTALAIAAAAACSTFSSTDTPAPADAGEDAPAPPPPGPLPPPAVVDAGADALYCSTLDASFCWSFDEGADPLRGPLLALNPSETSNPELSDAALTPPHAMECTTTDGGGFRSCALDLGRNASTHLRCDVDIYVASNDGGSFDPVAVLQQDFHTYGISVNGNRRAVLARDGFSGTDIGHVPFDTWTRIGLEVTVFAASTSATGYIEGASATRSDPYADAAAPVLGNFTFAFGPTYATAGWTVRYDNLVCNYE